MPKGQYPRLKRADLDLAKESDNYKTLKELREHAFSLMTLRNYVVADPGANKLSIVITSQLVATLDEMGREFIKIHKQGFEGSTLNKAKEAVDFNSVSST